MEDNHNIDQHSEDGLKWVQRDLDERLKSLEHRLDQRVAELQPKKNNRLFWVVIALAIFSLISYYITIKVFQKNIEPAQLYAQYYEPFPNVYKGQQRNISDDAAVDSLNSAINLYLKSDFEQAYKYIPKLEDKDNQQLIDLYRGLILTKIGRQNEAIEIFEKLQPSKITGISEAASWYESLALLSINETIDAKILLTKIANDSSHYKYKEAKEILIKMK